MKKIFLASFLCLAITATCLVALHSNRLNGFAFESENSKGVSVDCKSAYLMDYNSGEVLYSKNENEQMPIASMTKIMTLLIAFESIENGSLTLDDIITVSEKSASMGGSQAFLECGEAYTASELLKTIVIASANDSCVAIAERISGSVDGFVNVMNSRAVELGMNDTHFANCTGLPAPMHYSTSYNVALMTKELLSHETYFNYTKIWLDEFQHPTGRTTTLTNTNKLIRNYDGCDSGKTGFTNEAGHCISASAVKNNMRLISVVVGGSDSKSRFADCASMLDYGFANFQSKVVISSDDVLDFTINVKGGVIEHLNVRLSKSLCELVEIGSENTETTFEYKYNDKVVAPVKSGQVIGTLLATNNGKTTEIDIIADTNIDKATFSDIISRIINNFYFSKSK